jgi:Polyribonucleotide nucleotidyltransferase (polynucleotide phosphorylase)
MGTCIICGTPVDGGHVCESHQEDVLFEFRGNNASQLVSNRFYNGTVDGYADFGVFIDISPGVTGLLHRSELDRRLDSLDWEPGDTVCVKVTNVRDNGNIDLAKSIRQSEREFRGKIILDADGETLPSEVDADEEAPDPESTPAESDTEATVDNAADHDDDTADSDHDDTATTASPATQSPPTETQAEPEPAETDGEVPL